MAKEITHKDNIVGNILTNKIPHEDNINNYEEFNYITDFYLPIKDVEDKYSSPTLKRLRDNKVDAYEYLELAKVEGVGEVKKIEDKTELAEAKKNAGQYLLDFLNTNNVTTKAPGITTGVLESGANIFNNLVQLLGVGSNLLFKGGHKENDFISDATTRFAQDYNIDTEDFINKLDKIREDNDVGTASEIFTELGIDIGLWFPLRKMLKKTGMPEFYASSLAFGLSWGFSGGDERFEEGVWSGKDGVYIDSEVIHGVNEVFEALPNTPENEVKELVSNIFDGTVWGAKGELLGKVFMFLKKYYPAYMNRQTKKLATETGKVAAPGGIIGKSIYDTLNEDERIDNLEKITTIDEDKIRQEKNNLKFDDQNSDQTMMEEYYGSDKTFLEKLSEATGYPVEQLQQAKFQKILKDPTLLKKVKEAITPIFKSNVVKSVEKIPNKGSGPQILGQIKNIPGVKEAEIKWIGLDDFLKNKKTVTKQEVSDFVNQNRIDVNERKFGDFVDTPASKKSKPISDLSDDEVRKIQNRIWEDAENNNDDSLRYVADHLDYLRAAKGKRIDNFKIKKTEYMEGYDAPDITNQNWNFSNFMNDHALYRAVEGLDDYGGGAISRYYFDNTFANYYEVFGIKSKATKRVLKDGMEEKLYTDFAEKNMDLPEEMVRNADVHNGFHIQADEFENFKKYLDENGAYIMKYNHMEIPKDLREAVFNEMNIRSNEEIFYHHGFDNLMDALGEYTDNAFIPRAKWIGQTEHGGENYSELVFTLSKGGKNLGAKIPIETGVTKHSTIKDFQLRTSPHFDVAGEIAHVRFKTRMKGNMKVLSVEEMQSDLVQRAKLHNKTTLENRRQELIQAEGTRQIQRNRFENMSDSEIDEMLKDSPPEDFIKDFPFKNTWYELTLKRLIRYAADNGFDSISIPKGSVVQDRYKLTRRVEDLNITFFDKKRKEVGLMARDQNAVTQIDEIYTFDRIEKEFGKDVLDEVKIKAKKLDDLEYAEENYPTVKLTKVIEIGGEGKARLYNQAIPAFLKKYGKKWNAKVYDDTFDITDYRNVAEDEVVEKGLPVTIIEITDEMRKSVQQDSQALFNILGLGFGAKIASDSIKNNTISNQTIN